MASKTHYIQHAYQNWKKGVAFPAAPAATYLGLLTANPTESGSSASEVSGNGYARQAIPWGSLSDLSNGTQISNSSVVTFPTPTGPGWGTVTYAAEFDAVTGGNMIEYAAVTAISAPAGFVISFPVGNIVDVDQ